MRAVIKIEMDNEAFEDDLAGSELARILRELATRVEDCDCYELEDYQVSCMDFNGNNVGKLEVEGKPIIPREELNK